MSQNRPPPSPNGRTPPTPTPSTNANPNPASRPSPASSRPPNPATRPAGSPARTGRPGPPPAPKAAGSTSPRPTPATPRPTGRPAAPITPARRAGATPPRAPGLSGTITTRLDRAGLARFSTGRYLAIWVPAVILILGAILFLIYSGQNAPTVLPKFMTVETTKGTFKVQLYSDPADGVQNVVRNFATKAKGGYFNGKTFHRVEAFVIQGGDPQGNGKGGGSIPSQYNQKPFKRGAVGVASNDAGGPQINDSQWFVVKSDADYLDGKYSNFGQVVEGMDVVDKIVVGDKMTKLTVSDK